MSDRIIHITLKCANCGANLEITRDMSQFACGYCGASQIVERRGGTVALRLAEAISRVQAGTDKTAAELAIRRLHEESMQLGMIYRQRQQRGVAQKMGIPVISIGIAALAVFIAVIVGAISDAIFRGAGPIAGLVVVGMGAIVAYIAKLKRDADIDQEIQRDLDAITAQGNEIQRKIAKNKAIVDS